ncbi:MAG TPA: BON domain-containing protein [Thermoanaerobaculia bacterium]
MTGSGGCGINSASDASLYAWICCHGLEQRVNFEEEDDINPFNIDVDTNEGAVTLRGRVAKDAVRAKAERLVRQAGGVKRVINLIKVGDNM